MLIPDVYLRMFSIQGPSHSSPSLLHYIFLFLILVSDALGGDEPSVGLLRRVAETQRVDLAVGAREVLERAHGVRHANVLKREHTLHLPELLLLVPAVVLRGSCRSKEETKNAEKESEVKEMQKKRVNIRK